MSKQAPQRQASCNHSLEYLRAVVNSRVLPTLKPIEIEGQLFHRSGLHTTSRHRTLDGLLIVTSNIMLTVPGLTPTPLKCLKLWSFSYCNLHCQTENNTTSFCWDIQSAVSSMPWF